jgi:hypothetical protein
VKAREARWERNSQTILWFDLNPRQCWTLRELHREPVQTVLSHCSVTAGPLAGQPIGSSSTSCFPCRGFESDCLLRVTATTFCLEAGKWLCRDCPMSLKALSEIPRVCNSPTLHKHKKSPSLASFLQNSSKGLSFPGSCLLPIPSL